MESDKMKSQKEQIIIGCIMLALVLLGGYFYLEFKPIDTSPNFIFKWEEEVGGCKSLECSEGWNLEGIWCVTSDENIISDIQAEQEYQRPYTYDSLKLKPECIKNAR